MPPEIPENFKNQQHVAYGFNQRSNSESWKKQELLPHYDAYSLRPEPPRSSELSRLQLKLTKTF